jgi:hypothetical protein
MLAACMRAGVQLHPHPLRCNCKADPSISHPTTLQDITPSGGQAAATLKMTAAMSRHERKLLEKRKPPC